MFNLGTLFRIGLEIGFIVAAPVGPIALLIMRRTLNEGRLAGIVSGFGAATADLICGSVAVFGISAITTMIDAHRGVLQLVGGLFMVVLGLRIFRAKDPAAANRPLHERNLFLAYAFTLLLTLSNPMTLLGLVGVVAAFNVGSAGQTHLEMAGMAAGIFLGSALWWILLCNVAGWLGRRLGNKSLHVVNMSAGAAILIFGLWQLCELALRLRTPAA